MPRRPDAAKQPEEDQAAGNSSEVRTGWGLKFQRRVSPTAARP